MFRLWTPERRFQAALIDDAAAEVLPGILAEDFCSLLERRPLSAQGVFS